MELSEDLQTVYNESLNYLLTGVIPDFQRQLISSTLQGSPVKFIVTVAESLYAVSDELDEEGLRVAAQAANLASLYSWSGMKLRGTEMVTVLREKSGEDIEIQNIPKVKDAYLEPIMPTETYEQPTQ